MRKHTCYFVIDSVINRSLESDWEHWGINHAICTASETSQSVIQSIFQLPVACISGLVSHMGSQETTGAICLYGHISILHFTSHSTWHWLYISIHTSVWVYISLSGVWEQNIGWFTSKGKLTSRTDIFVTKRNKHYDLFSVPPTWTVALSTNVLSQQVNCWDMLYLFPRSTLTCLVSQSFNTCLLSTYHRKDTVLSAVGDGDPCP